MSETETTAASAPTTIAGNVGQKPTKRQTSKGTVVNFTVAENISKDETRWWRVGIWGEGLHNPVLKSIKVGSRVVVTGKGYTTKFKDEDQFNLNGYRVGLVDYLFPDKKGDEPRTDEEEVGW